MQAVREGLLAKMVLYSLEIFEFARQHASQDKSINIIVAQLSKVTYCFLIGLVACSRKGNPCLVLQTWSKINH